MLFQSFENQRRRSEVQPPPSGAKHEEQQRLFNGPPLCIPEGHGRWIEAGEYSRMLEPWATKDDFTLCPGMNVFIIGEGLVQEKMFNFEWASFE